MKNIKIGTWYRIPKYNGYEICFTSYPINRNCYPVNLKHEGINDVWFTVRSWKNYKKLHRF